MSAPGTLALQGGEDVSPTGMLDSLSTWSASLLYCVMQFNAHLIVPLEPHDPLSVWGYFVYGWALSVISVAEGFLVIRVFQAIGVLLRWKRERAAHE